MKENYLFPNQFKKIGWIVFIPALILGLFFIIYQFDPIFSDVKLFAILTSGIGPWESGISFFEIIKTNIMDELLGLLIIIGLLFIAFSKEKSEDEFILKIRLESLVWATYINYIILILVLAEYVEL